MQRSLLSFFGKSTNTSKPNLGALGNQLNVRSRSGCANSEEHTSDVSEDEISFSGKRNRKRLVFDSSDEEDSAPAKSLIMDESVDISRLSAYACSPTIPVKTNKRHKPSNEGSNSNLDESVTERELNGSFSIHEVTWEHLRLPFLKDDHIRDGLKHRKNEADYDPRTLYVPADFLNKQSPGMRQWWKLKSKYADVLLFFKLGKFYEMYHMDAVIGVEELGLIYMRGAYAHCGFPEIAYPRMCERLVRKGYKVGRVEQTEAVEEMTERTRGKPSSEKVVRREVCQLQTPGTCLSNMRTEICQITPSISDTDDISSSRDIFESDTDSFLLAILDHDPHSVTNNHYGIALFDARSGRIQLGQFIDDRHGSRLRTLIAHHYPSQVIVERGSIGQVMKQILTTCLNGIPVEYLTRAKQFWSAKDTIQELEKANYFRAESVLRPDDQHEYASTGKDHWPAALLHMLSDEDPLRRSVKPDYDLALSCFGAVIFYLRYCLIDRAVLSLGFIDEYHPPDEVKPSKISSKSNEKVFYAAQSSLVLDSITLANLDILRNSSTGTREGTLLERLDSCCTPFGCHLLRQWLTAPPCDPHTIRRRQDAITNLMELTGQLTEVKENLRKLPDFERLLSKIHVLGSRGKDPTHPDNRAVLYEELQYSRRNILDFVATLNGFEAVYELLDKLKSLPIHSPYLNDITKLVEEGGRVPSLKPTLIYFRNAFDAEKAKRDGRITPEPGVDVCYDQAVEDIKCIVDELDIYLCDWKNKLGVRLSYWGNGRNRFQIEVADNNTSRVPSTWQLASQRKGAKRYRTDETLDLLAQLTSAESRKDASLRGIMQTIFATFSESFAQWNAVVRCIAEFDCLLSLATYSSNAAATTCCPIFIDLDEGAEQPLIEIVDGLHPSLINTFTGCDLIPNDVCLGSNVNTSPSTPLTLLVTGPNMGGKSTLMRQTALLVILAHLGCRIPAKSCRLTPVDRIFSRLGASDRLLAGESTFMVELSETAAILRHTTAHSLVLMDELGRGTSTHDGAALASAVLQYLSKSFSTDGRFNGPRTLFSTHYHSLVDGVTATRREMMSPIGLGHMACMVEENSSTCTGLEHITFLYKFTPGACPKSYGFNAARLAHLPDNVIQVGLAKAKEFERTSTTFHCLREMLNGKLTVADAKAWKSKLEAFN